MKTTKHNHAEAFCLMRYESKDGRIVELLWNSRDGVTPFMILSKDGKTQLHHVEWQLDRYSPNHQLMPGDRYFADITQEAAERYAAANIKASEGSEYYPPTAEERAELLKRLVASSMDQPGQPDVLTWSLGGEAVADPGTPKI